MNKNYIACKVRNSQFKLVKRKKKKLSLNMAKIGSYPNRLAKQEPNQN